MQRCLTALLISAFMSIGPASAESDAILYSPGLNCVRPSGGPQGIWGDIPVFVKLGISQNGAKQWNGAPVSENLFQEYIKDAAKLDYQPIFVIVAQPETTVATLLPILEQLQRAGLKKIKLADVKF